MDVWWISEAGADRRDVGELPSLLTAGGGFTWVDVPGCDDGDARILSDVLGFHRLAVQACVTRSHVPSLHAYPGYMFAIVHAPEPGDEGHVHLLELDQFVGINFLVTVHGPLAAGVPMEAALRETASVLQRIHQGRFRPTSTAELSHAIVSGIARKLDGYVSAIASRIAGLEHRVMQERMGDPEELLEDMFKVQHELLTIRTMAAQSRAVYARVISLMRWLPPEAQMFIEDLADQFERVQNVCDGEKEFLLGVISFYQSRVHTKMNVAMERLALITALALPITAVSGLYGMNIIANDRTDFPHLVLLLILTITMVVMLLRWARRQGWW